MVKYEPYRAGSTSRIPHKKTVGRKKKRSVGQTRKFGKKTYEYYEPYMHKTEAKQAAKALRNKGCLARVVPARENTFRVYIKEKKSNKK